MNFLFFEIRLEGFALLLIGLYRILRVYNNNNHFYSHNIAHSSTRVQLDAQQKDSEVKANPFYRHPPEDVP